MENNETSSNWNQPSGTQGGQQPVPNAMGAFVLGIISLCMNALCCCYGEFPALVLGIIGFVLGNGAIKAYNANPGNYDEKSFRKAKTGKMLSMIGMIVAIVLIIVFIILIASGSANSYNYEEMLRRMK